MANGDQPDFITRLRNLLPASWFPNGPLVENPYPVLAGLLSGFGNAASTLYSMLKYARAQQRLQTTSDAFLDMAAVDYCGNRLPRRSGETDQSYRSRITNEIVRIRNTRNSLVVALTQLTCRVPIVLEPWNTNDTGAYGYAYYGGGAFPGGVGLYGSTNMPFTMFVMAFRPISFTIPDSEIYDAANAVRTAGVTIYLSLQN